MVGYSSERDSIFSWVVQRPSTFWAKFCNSSCTVYEAYNDEVRSSVLELMAEQLEAFETLEHVLTHAPLLYLPKVDRQFTGKIDASAGQIGFVLTDVHKGVHHPV